MAKTIPPKQDICIRNKIYLIQFETTLNIIIACIRTTREAFCRLQNTQT